MHVLVAGEGAVRDAWADMLSNRHRVTCIGPDAHPERASIVGPVTDPDTFDGVPPDLDAVVDLPVVESEDARFETQLHPYHLTYRLLETCCDASIETYIVGSSNMVVQGYEVEHAPELYDRDHDLLLDHTATPRPLSMYGVSRLFSEQLCYRYVKSTDWHVGRLHVEEREFPARVYVLRWGSLRPDVDVDHPYVDAEYGVSEGLWERGSSQYDLAVNRMKATWFSHRDWEQLVTAMLDDTTVDYGIFYGVSDNDRRWFDIEHARETLGYHPEDNAEAWDGPPAA